MNPRQVLFHYWARWSKWTKYQPLDNVREYFGEKIALYFAWLGFYTGWLIPPSVVGMLIFIYGLLTVDTDPVSSQVCSSRHRMCPLCEENLGCHSWELSDVCTYSRLSYLFDNSGTVAFAIFVSFWAVTFLEYWKRHSVQLVKMFTNFQVGYHLTICNTTFKSMYTGTSMGRHGSRKRRNSPKAGICPQSCTYFSFFLLLFLFFLLFKSSCI